MAKVRYAAPVAAVMGKLGRADEMSFRRHGRFGVYQKSQGRLRPATEDQAAIRTITQEIQNGINGLSVGEVRAWEEFAAEEKRRKRQGDEAPVWRELYRKLNSNRRLAGSQLRDNPPTETTNNYARPPFGFSPFGGSGLYRVFFDQEAPPPAGNWLNVKISRPYASEVRRPSRGDWRLAEKASHTNPIHKSSPGTTSVYNVIFPYWTWIPGEWVWCRVTHLAPGLWPNRVIEFQVQIA